MENTTTLSPEEQKQLDALMAKKELAEKIAEELPKAIKEIGERKRAHDRSLHISDNEAKMIARAFNALKSETAPTGVEIELESTDKQIVTTIFPVYSWKENFSEETQAAALKEAGFPGRIAFEDTSKDLKMKVVGHNIRLTYSTHNHGYQVDDYSNRYMTNTKNVLKKIKRIISENEAAVEAQRSKNELKANAIEEAQLQFPDAEVTAGEEWKVTNYRNGRGYYIKYVKVETDGLAIYYKYYRSSEGADLIFYKTDVNITEALAKMDSKKLVETLKGFTK